MTINEIECPNPECGAFAFEVPEPDGTTRCAACGHEICVDSYDMRGIYPRMFEDDDR